MFELYYSNCPVPSAFVVAMRAFEQEFDDFTIRAALDRLRRLELLARRRDRIGEHARVAVLAPERDDGDAAGASASAITRPFGRRAGRCRGATSSFRNRQTCCLLLRAPSASCLQRRSNRRTTPD